MSPEKLIQATLFTLVAICAVYYSDAVADAEPRSMVESPVLKEMEYKKSLYYNRKPVTAAPGKIPLNVKKGAKPLAKTPIRRVPTKPIHGTPIRSMNSDTIRAATPSAASSTSSSGGAGGNAVRNEPSSTSTSVATSATNSTGSNITETAASDRIFIPPYKMPFWGMPYGVYSNGGFINPGLFPFVPGGPGFPPYDGIFGSPFGPGSFPGNQNPFPKGTGTPMDTGPLPVPPMPYGQPPLNPTGRRSNGPPPGSFSPGSPMGYYYRRPTAKRPAPPTKSKKKKKPKPEPEADEDGGGIGGGGGCGCNKKGKDDAPSYSKRPRTTSTTPDPCPCGATSSSPKPSYRKEPIDDDDDHYHHHHHHDHSDIKYKQETSPCPLATPPTTPTTTEYIPPPPPPPSTPAYEPSTEPAPTTEYSSSTPSETTYKTRRPCRLRHKSPPSPVPQRIVYYDYDSPEPSQLPPPTRKPCPLKRQKNYERNDYNPYATQSPPPPPAVPQPTPVAIYQASPAPLLQSQQYQPLQYPAPPHQYPQPQPFPYPQAQPQYIASHVPQESQQSQNTVLYKPIPQDIVHTPTSVTVPLPFPYVMDSNGMLQPHPSTMQNSQQVTYKVDLNQDLLAKITTPIVVSQSQSQQQHQYNQHNQSPTHQLSSTGNQYMLDGHPISISNSQILHSKAQSYMGQSSSPSVIVLNSDSLYDTRQQHYQQPQMYTSTPSSPVTVSYLHPSSTPSSIPGYSSTPSTSDYRILLADSTHKNMESSRHQIQNSLPLPYRALTSYQVEQPPRRSQHAITKNDEDSTLPNKNYVIIDRAELEELKKTFTSTDDNSPHAVSERNVPPPPDVVHIEFHSKVDEDKENSNRPLSFQSQSYNQRARRVPQQQPKSTTNFVESATEPIAEGSTQFSRIFDLNNEDILSAGRKKSSVDRDSGSNHATILRTSLIFDKYLKND